jgi:hypothetical protein
MLWDYAERHAEKREPSRSLQFDPTMIDRPAPATDQSDAFCDIEERVEDGDDEEGEEKTDVSDDEEDDVEVTLDGDEEGEEKTDVNDDEEDDLEITLGRDDEEGEEKTEPCTTNSCSHDVKNLKTCRVAQMHWTAGGCSNSNNDTAIV